MAVERPPLELWHQKASEVPAHEQAPPVLNAEVVRKLAEWDRIAAFGVVWTAPPTPFTAGVALAKLRQRWDQAAEAEDGEALAEVFHEAVGLITTLVHPVPWGRRLLYRLGLWRPWRHMSGADFARVLGFLLTSRTRCSVQPWMPGSGHSH